MASDAVTAAEEARRQGAAASLLDDALSATAMARRVARVDPAAAPGGLLLAGGARLRGARRVGLLAASANPLTHAHIALAQAARQTAQLDALLWVGVAVTVDKERVARATLADRLLETRAYARYAGDAVALLNRGLYVDQARAARSLLAPGAEFTFVVGFDKIEQIFDPRYYHDRDAALRDLFAEASVLVAPREGQGEQALTALLAQPENRPYAGRVAFCLLPADYARDSSSAARALAAKREPEGREGAAALHALVAPEGLALAALGPYAGELSPSAHSLGDVYSARQVWIRALSRLPTAALRRSPPLHDLLAWSGEASAGGEALRAWAWRWADASAPDDSSQALSALRAALAFPHASSPTSR